MVVDTSALLAILLHEPESFQFSKALLQAPTLHISAVSVLEASMVLVSRKGHAVTPELDASITGAGMKIAPFDTPQMLVARSAFERYGKGRHPARLNFGDCAAYALAMSLGEPLLFKGNDFALTDVIRVVPQ